MPNNDTHGAIRLNVAGREPLGILQPGFEVEQAIAAIREDLASFTNVGTGRSIVRAIHRIEDLYPGESTDAFPDLIVDWDISAPTEVVESPKFGRLARKSKSPRSGDHRPDGLLIASGPGIEPDHATRTVDSVDVAATVAALLEVEIPGLDGHPIRGVVPSA